MFFIPGLRRYIHSEFEFRNFGLLKRLEKEACSRLSVSEAGATPGKIEKQPWTPGSGPETVRGENSFEQRKLASKPSNLEFRSSRVTQLGVTGGVFTVKNPI